MMKILRSATKFIGMPFHKIKEWRYKRNLERLKKIIRQKEAEIAMMEETSKIIEGIREMFRDVD